MRINRAIPTVLTMSMAVLLTGCMSFAQRPVKAPPFLTVPAPAEGPGELVLLAAMQGKIIDDNGCFVLKAHGHKAAVIFAHGFTLDWQNGIITDGSVGGRTVRIGKNGRFSGGTGTRDKAEVKLGLSMPETCPEKVVQIDEIKD